VKRRAFTLGVAGMVGCRRGEAPRPEPVPAASDPDVLPLRPPRTESPEAASLVVGPIARLRESRERAPFLIAEVGGVTALLLVATREAPQRWRPQVAMFRLAARLGLDVVPATVARREPLAALLGAAEDEAARATLRDASTLPDGRVPLSVGLLPAGGVARQTIYSNEAARWARLAESPDVPTGDAARTDASYVSMMVLDYLSGNLFRRVADETPDGRLLLLDSRTAFTEHPEARAVDAMLERLKRARRFPAALRASLPALDERAADEDLRAGDYESWLLHKRAIRELLLRARAVRGLVESRQ
jgi:hypothetical protein